MNKLSNCLGKFCYALLVYLVCECARACMYICVYILLLLFLLSVLPLLCAKIPKRKFLSLPEVILNIIRSLNNIQTNKRHGSHNVKLKCLKSNEHNIRFDLLKAQYLLYTFYIHLCFEVRFEIAFVSQCEV